MLSRRFPRAISQFNLDDYVPSSLQGDLFALYDFETAGNLIWDGTIGSSNLIGATDLSGNSRDLTIDGTNYPTFETSPNRVLLTNNSEVFWLDEAITESAFTICMDVRMEASSGHAFALREDANADDFVLVRPQSTDIDFFVRDNSGTSFNVINKTHSGGSQTYAVSFDSGGFQCYSSEFAYTDNAAAFSVPMNAMYFSIAGSTQDQGSTFGDYSAVRAYRAVLFDVQLTEAQIDSVWALMTNG